MKTYLEHHLLAALSTNCATRELISTLPENDAVIEIKDLLISQLDIINCIIHQRHFGSDSLDCVISECNSVFEQVKELEDR